MNRIFTVLGIFLLFSFHLAAQTITGVSIPAGNYKINDAITINFVSANTAGTALVAGSTVNGVALTGFTNLTGGNYSAIYTVVATNTDRASVGVIPINIGLTSGTDGPFFTAVATSGGTVTIDANSPTVSSIVKASTDPSNATNVNFTVTFNELVDATTLTTADFDLTLTSGVTATVNSVAPATGTSTTFTVNVNAISANEGTLRLNKTNNAYSDAIGNSSTATFSPGAGGTYSIDRLAPSVSSIVKASTDPSNATNVNFTVTFSELVDATTLTTADFDLTLTGGVTATVNSVTPATGTSTTFTVNVNAISANEGTLRLNKTNDVYSDAIGNSSTATFSTGEVYTIDRLAPTVSGIVRASTNPSSATNVDFTVTFSELVDATTLTTADFDLTLTGGVTATVNSVTPATGTSTTFTVNVNAISNNQGTLQLNKTNNAYSDVIGNSSTATFSTGEVYTIDRLAPTADAPDAFQTVQSLKSGATSSSQVRSTKSGAIYLVKNGTAVTTQAQINAAITAKNAFLGKSAAVANTGYTITIPIASLINDGNYNIVAVDGSGNVSTPSSGADSWLTVDNTAPTVAITLVSATPSTATALDFTITFSEPVTGVDLTDFLLATGTANDATGTIANLSGTGAVYTVTVNSITGQNSGGSYGILNLDFIASPGITDGAANAFAGSVTTDNQYLVDNTKPSLSPDVMSLQLNGGAAETITFTINEDLNVPDGTDIKNGFSVSSGGIASAIYTSSTKKVTMTSAANAQWNVPPTVSYVRTTGLYTDMIGNQLQDITAHLVEQLTVTMIAGDIAFTSFRSANTGNQPDQFSIVLLRSIPANTTIYFTDRGWNTTTSTLIDFTDDGLFSWKSSTAVPAGTEIVFTGTSSPSNTNNNFTSSLPSFGAVTNDADKLFIRTSGDAILAYQTDGTSIIFLAAVSYGNANPPWVVTGIPTNQDESGNPGLPATATIIAGDKDNGAYLRTASASTYTGSATQLRTLISNISNWDLDNTEVNVDLPGDTQPSVWSSFPVLNNPNSLNYVIRPKINAVNIPDVAMKIGDVVTATISVDDDASATPVTLTSGTMGGFTLGSFTRINATTYTAQFTVTEGGTDVAAGSNVPVANLIVQNGAGLSNTAFSGNDTPAGTTDAIDANSPYVVSINRNTTATTTTSYSANTGTTATSVVFRVTFSENMANGTLAANDFAVIAASGLTGAPSINNISAVTGTSVFDITVTGYTGTGTIGLNYVDSEAGPGGSVTDLIGNPTKSAALAANGSFTGQTFSIVLPTPASEVFTLTESNVTGNSVTLSWNPTNPLPLPTNYLVIASPATPPTAPADGTPVADGIYAINLPVGTNTHTFNSLQSGTSYNFAVYKYALSPNNTSINIDFETTSPAIKNAVVTNTAVTSSMLLNSTPVDIGSIKTTNATSVEVMNFTIFDDGQDPLVPNAMTLRLNGTYQETITFTLRDQLTLGEGASVTGFTSSTGTVATAKYTGKGTTNTITLTSLNHNEWTAATTISYSAVSGNAVFLSTVGKMQPIVSHPVAQAVEVVDPRTSNGTFTVPAGVTSIVVEAWGGGGGGGSGLGGSFWDAGGGGGGGGYSRSILNVTPGSVYNVTVGAGGGFNFGAGLSGNASNFGSGTVIALGGAGGNANTGSSPGSGGAGAVAGTGDIKFSGGSGRQGFFGSAVPTGAGVGGGGGSSAGSSANGITATSSIGASAPTGGGNGGSGINISTGTTGLNPGGGGGGSGNGFGGAGGNGQIIITYSNPVAPSGTSDWVGDNSPFKISQLTITQETAGTTPALMGKLDDVIAGAELSCASCGAPANGTVGPTSITFTSLSPTGSAGDIGVIPDASGATSSKTYSLKIWLRDDIEVNDKALAAAIDGMTLDFKIDPAIVSSIGYDDVTNSNQKSSRLMASHPALVTGANEITVDATQLDFSTNPISPAYVYTNVTATSIPADNSTVPVVRAHDLYGNTDKDYSATLAISNAGGILTSNSTLSMTAGVAAFPSTFQYQDAGNGTLTVSDGAGPLTGDAISSPVTVIYSNTTTITLGTVAPLISSLKTSNPYLRVFDFNITDDNGSGGDGAPTRFNNLILNEGPGDDFSDWLEALDDLPTAGILLYDGTTSVFGTIGANTITFSGINPNTLGYVTDNTTKTYQVWILLKSAMGGTLPDNVDNKNFVFRIQDTFITTAGSSSAFTGTNDINSGASNIRVDVIASKLKFSADPAASLLVGKDISSQLPVPMVEALDANNNRDLNYNSTTVNVTNSGSLTMSSIPGNGSFINGLLTFPSTFQFNTTGTGVTLNVSSSAPAPALPGVLSTTSTSFDVRGGDAGTITAGALIEPSTISSLVDLTHTPSGLPVFDFIINDDPAGTPAGEDDGNPTQLTGLYIRAGSGNTVLGWDDAFATATLSDGTNTVTVTTIHSSNYFYFDLSSVAGQALGLIADNGSKTYTLKVWLKTAMGGTLPTTIDGKSFVFDVKKTPIDITTGVNSTNIIAGQTQNSGIAKNQVDVHATQIDFTTQPISASVSVPVAPQIIVSARDINANLDINFNSGVTITGNTPVDPGPFVTANDPASGDLFNAGQLTYPANFQFTVGDGDVKLTISAGGISGTSAVISSLTSYDSWLYFDPTFGYTPKIDFANKQEDPTTATSQILGRLILSDGGSATSIATFDPTPFNPLDDALYNPQRGVKNQLNHGDSDGAFTRISDFTISLSNFQDIRKIALYASDGVTQIGTDKTPAATVTFNNIGDAHKAPDNGIYTYYIRASFKTTVTDLDQIAMQVTAVTHHSGSKFSEQLPVSPPATIAGFDGATTFGDSSPLTVAGVPVNILDVIATSLDFTHQANPPYAGINEPVGKVSPLFTVPYATAPLPNTDAAIVSARDKFANLDTEFNYAPTITQTAGPNTPISPPRNFAAGILRLDGMQYPATGDGTLKVIANGIDSSTPASGTHIPGQLVNVVHVSVIPATAGVLSTPNIKGGTPNAVLFGVTFTPDFSTTSEPNLKKFVFSFDDFYATSSSTILKNFRVTESLSAAFSGSTDVTLSSAIVTTGSSTNSTDLDLVIVDWGSNPSRPLFDISTGAPVSRSYFLVADVDVSANIGTPNLTPQLVDGGYISSSTDAHIVTSAGTATSNVIGQKYQFASTRPPVLKANLSSPFNGQLNVDAGLTEIDLVFDVQVWSLDGVGELFSRTNNKKVANLNAINGNYVDLSTPAVNPLRFSINFLPGESFQPDEVYYVTIKKGSFNNNNNTGSGISDNGFNFYGGISSNATLYFKISSLNPPNLISAKSYFGNGTTASFSTNFDQAGTAHYMVLPTGSSAPSAAQIRNPLTYPGYPVTVTAADNYAITQVNTFQTVSFSAALSAATYDVWIVSENDANPTHKATTAPYGSSAVSFAIGGAGPTLKITVPTPAPIRSNNFPTYSVCPDSYTTLSEPIIIGEPASGTFNLGATLQTFYILLPTGFQFDGVTKPTVSLNGVDFDQSSLNVDFENNTLLEISYRNTTSTSIDNIVITGLKVKGTSGSNLGYIKRFAGNANLGGASQLATIFLATAQIHTFTNSYSKDNDFTPFGFSSLDVITAIPDNYVDEDTNLTGAIRLQPTITAANDYGASFFTGNGVTNDVLSLSAVTVDAAFDITMTHTDPNGCTSESSVQYVVYDHRRPISIKLGQSLGGTQQSLVNPNFPNQAPAMIFPNNTSPQINYNELAGYNLIKLFATIPTNAGTQIISGPDWKNQIAKIPVVKTQYPTSNIPGMPPGTGFYRDYQWDYNHILNAVSESQLDNSSTSIVKDPYDNFKVTPTGKAPYWTGGSLGKIEFVGTYQSTADFTVLVPFKQQVELFVPPIPVVEVDQSNQPVKGTAIYCEAGGGISITGYPQASAASSTGIFSLTTSTGTPLAVPPGAFIDNGNGTATLFPNLFSNAYSDIKINYTYQDNNSPVSGVGSTTVTVAPNPISALTIASIIGPNTPFTNVFCEKTTIDFNASASSITNGFIKDYVWSFGDITNSTGTNPNIDSTMVSKHTFIQPAAYTISLTTTSNVGCVSMPKTSTLKVGSIPTVAFEFKGVSVDEGITFKNTSAIPSESISGLGDGFAKVDWNYGDGTPFNSVTAAPFTNTDIVHKYATAGLDHVNLTVSSLLGCVNTFTQDIIVLANEKPSPIASYEENFETSNGKWQPSALPITSGATNPASWIIGAPSNPVIKIDPTINNGQFVKTGAVSYNPSERSAFYSPVFDLSELDRPMVSFNSFIQLETSDGVVFEYSTDDKNVADPSKTWFALGQPGEGVQWFTDRGIAAKPGNQIGNDYGWSKADITKWVESKHLIDATAKAPRVVFRFALASVKAPAVDGFAFDNFRVGERTRTILMENFTTTNGKDAAQNNAIKTENDFINTTFETGGIGTTIVKLNYHIGFTGTDPFNADAPADPSARALYYNVKDVPYALLDGARPDGAAALSSWGVDAYNAQTLQLGRSKITVPDLSVNADGSIRFNIDVQALLYDLPENTILHVALIEQDILKSALSVGQQAQILTGEDSSTYVLKQMLPNALGTKLGALLAKNQTKQFKGFEYYPDPTRLYANANDLAIIVFLQNEDTKEIYQTEYVTGINDPAVVTGVELPASLEDVSLYPNPADHELTILLPRKAIGDVTIQLFDQVGKSVLNSTIKNGEQKGTLNVQGLAESMYLMRLVENGEITMKKVIVVHQN